MENAKIQKFKCDILSNFQTMFATRTKESISKWAGIQVFPLFIFKGSWMQKIPTHQKRFDFQ